jgi:pyrroline-5-carboxylate reductase
MTIELKGPLLLAGAGKMGGALLAGWLERGLDRQRVIVQDPDPPPEVRRLLAQHGMLAHPAVAELAEWPAVIVIAVKPQLMDEVLPPVARLVGPNTLLLSIAAGRTVRNLEAHLPAGTAVIRSIPNTPAAIGLGITVCCANAHVTPDQRQLSDALLSAVGDVAWVVDESEIDAATAISGSGPAYVFLFAECLAEAGKAAGLEQALATRLANATVSGAGALLQQSGLEAAALRRNVTSPHGTTAAALSTLMSENGLQPLLTRAVLAALQRSRELSA